MEKEHKSKHKPSTNEGKSQSSSSDPSMEHRHEGKHEGSSVKKDVSIGPKESPAVEKVHTEHTPDTALGTFPKNTKKNKTWSIFPSHILAIGIFCLAFAIGGIFAKVIPNISFDFLNNLRSQKPEEILTETVTESTSSPTESQNASGENPALLLKTQPPEIAAKAYGIFKLNNGEYQLIADKMPDLTLPMASVTKIMTAVVAMEQYDLDKPIVVPEKCVALNGSSIGFRANDVLSLQDMLYGLLVRSGADAACAISNIDNEADFTAFMNKRAAELGMNSTKFTNVIGFDNGDSHVSNVSDLKILVSHALKFSTFRKIVGTEEIILTSKSNGAVYKIRNTNDLLFSIPGTVGIKTGYTDSAGECLAYLYQNKNEEILIIILGSSDRFGDTSKLLEWAKIEIAPDVSDASTVTQANN